MNNFQNKHFQGQLRANGSIDGFVMPRNKLDLPKSRKPVDNFRRPNGFQAKAAASPTAALQDFNYDQPVILDTSVNNKRSLKDKILRRNAQPWTRKRRIITGVVVSFTIILLIGGFLVFKGYLNLNKILNGGGGAVALAANVDPSKLKGEGDGRVNILVLGRGGEGHEGADLTDTIVLASIDPVAKEASLLSIPRDLYVPVSGAGSMKINAAFATGKEAALAKQTRSNRVSERQADDAGFALIEKTLEQNLGIPIHYHAIVDFSGFKQAIDTVGGIDLNVTTGVEERMRIDGRTYQLNVQPGQQHMDGFKALAFSRTRQTSVRGDFDRAERQRLVILALKQKILTAGTFSNPTKINGLLNTLGDHVSTNFSLQDINRLMQLGKEINGSKIKSIGLADPPNNYVTTANVGGLSVVVPSAGNSDYSAIKGYLRNVLKDSYLKSENAKILVLNGTQIPGLASNGKEKLQSFGYNVIDAQNAPSQEYTTTQVIDLRNGSKKYTKNYLEKRFGVTAVNRLPDPAIQPGTADFVILLGNDQKTSP